jgi:hypothetical protein
LEDWDKSTIDSRWELPSLPCANKAFQPEMVLLQTQGSKLKLFIQNAAFIGTFLRVRRLGFTRVGEELGSRKQTNKKEHETPIEQRGGFEVHLHRVSWF